MNKYEIIKKIEKAAPPEISEAWDCSGFMTETPNTEVSKIMLCLTPVQDVICQAQEQNCDMIISHHPLFYVPCCWSCIDIYSAHTNLDKAQGGTTDTLVKSVLSLMHAGFKKNIVSDDEFVRYIDLETSVNICDFARVLKIISPHLRYVNNRDVQTLKRIAFCAGSGSSFIQKAQENGADAFVTGDLKFHGAVDGQIVIFDIGHFESEILILPVLKDIIGSGVEVVFAKEQSPFKYV